jgi:coenzyme F420-reducing hydrogenase gamma subunit
MKAKVAFFEFTSCEGCQLEVLNQGAELLELLKNIEIVRFREALSEKRDDYEIAIIEGSISTPAQVTQIKEIRSRAKTLIAMGACAVQGGVNTLRNRRPIIDVKHYVYGDEDEHFTSILANPVSAFVKVDYNIRGCPISTHDFIRFIKQLLLGIKPFEPDYPMCVECKLNENICVFDKGMVCIGPVTRAGCNAICPTYGKRCEGCRGLVSEPNVNAHRETLIRYGLTPRDIIAEYDLFGMFDEEVEE